jgi:ABC-2 type transport system permease protein
MLIGVFHTLFSRNFERFSRLVLYGALDSVLVKPIDPQFLVSFWQVNYAGLFRVLIGGAYMVYLVRTLAINVPATAFIGFVFFLFTGIILLYSIWFIASTITIWYPRLTNIVDVMYTISSMSRFPREMYQQLAWYLFLFLAPLTFIIVTPVRSLLRNAAPAEYIGLVAFSFVFFFVSRKFWKYALRFYTSASS